MTLRFQPEGPWELRIFFQEGSKAPSFLLDWECLLPWWVGSFLSRRVIPPKMKNKIRQGAACLPSSCTPTCHRAFIFTWTGQSDALIDGTALIKKWQLLRYVRGSEVNIGPCGPLSDTALPAALCQQAGCCFHAHFVEEKAHSTKHLGRLEFLVLGALSSPLDFFP